MIFSTHAIAKCAERGIDVKEVERIVNDAKARGFDVKRQQVIREGRIEVVFDCYSETVITVVYMNQKHMQKLTKKGSLNKRKNQARKHNNNKRAYPKY